MRNGWFLKFGFGCMALTSSGGREQCAATEQAFESEIDRFDSSAPAAVPDSLPPIPKVTGGIDEILLRVEQATAQQLLRHEALNPRDEFISSADHEELRNMCEYYKAHAARVLDILRRAAEEDLLQGRASVQQEAGRQRLGWEGGARSARMIDYMDHLCSDFAATIVSWFAARGWISNRVLSEDWAGRLRARIEP